MLSKKIPPATPANHGPLPERVLAVINEQQDASERLVGWFQLADRVIAGVEKPVDIVVLARKAPPDPPAGRHPPSGFRLTFLRNNNTIYHGYLHAARNFAALRTKNHGYGA